MGFLGCNIMRKGGSKIYQPFRVGEDCNYTLYTDSVTGKEYKIPFVPCNQLYVLDELVTVLGNNVAITGV